MLIKGSRGSFRLHLTGRQFPLAQDPDDANWLMVGVDVTTDRGSWRFHEPCLDLQEARQLVTWLRSAAEGSLPLGSLLEFTEPNIAFTLVERSPKGVILRILFSHESLPPFARQHSEYAPTERFQPEPVVFDALPAVLSEAADQLEAELRAVR